MADDGLVNMSNQFAGLPMRDLIGGPLQAACDAQNMLAAATSNFIQYNYPPKKLTHFDIR